MDAFASMVPFCEVQTPPPKISTGGHSIIATITRIMSGWYHQARFNHHAFFDYMLFTGLSNNSARPSDPKHHQSCTQVNIRLRSFTHSTRRLRPWPFVRFEASLQCWLQSCSLVSGSSVRFECFPWLQHSVVRLRWMVHYLEDSSSSGECRPVAVVREFSRVLPQASSHCRTARVAPFAPSRTRPGSGGASARLRQRGLCTAGAWSSPRGSERSHASRTAM